MWARFMCNGRAVTAGHGLTCKASKLGARARAILVYVLSAAVHAWHRAWCLMCELGDSREKTTRFRVSGVRKRYNEAMPHED